MSRLTKDKYGDGRKEGRMLNGTFMGRENGDHLPAGISVDGVVYTLAGQPPVATSRGWGYMGWLLQNRY